MKPDRNFTSVIVGDWYQRIDGSVIQLDVYHGYSPEGYGTGALEYDLQYHIEPPVYVLKKVKVKVRKLITSYAHVGKRTGVVHYVAALRDSLPEDNDIYMTVELTKEIEVDGE